MTTRLVKAGATHGHGQPPPARRMQCPRGKSAHLARTPAAATNPLGGTHPAAGSPPPPGARSAPPPCGTRWGCAAPRRTCPEPGFRVRVSGFRVQDSGFRLWVWGGRMDGGEAHVVDEDAGGEHGRGAWCRGVCVVLKGNQEVSWKKREFGSHKSQHMPPGGLIAMHKRTAAAAAAVAAVAAAAAARACRARTAAAPHLLVRGVDEQQDLVRGVGRVRRVQQRLRVGRAGPARDDDLQCARVRQQQTTPAGRADVGTSE